MRVTRKTIVFDIYAALYGNGMFIAWWLGETQPGVLDLFTELPLVGRAIESFIHPTTCYSLDASAYFQRSIHNSVLEVVDSLTDTNNLRELSEEERVPLLDNYYEW